MITLNHNGTDITLTQDAYLENGTLPLQDGAYYNGSRYQAAAEDAEGNEYMVYWFDPIESEDGDQSNACDWDSPDFIQPL